MATKLGLSKAQIIERDELVASITIASKSLADAIDSYNETVRVAREALDAKIAEYNEALEPARGFASDFASAMSDAVGERSEKWQESEKGEAASSFVSEWEGAEFGDFEIDDVEEIEAPEEDAAETLENLPESPEE